MKDNDLPTLSRKEELILEMLIARGEAYGLELVGESNGALKRGTVYVTLGRMEDKNYIESRLEDDSGGINRPLRRLYRLTGHGRRVLQAWELVRSLLAVAT